VEHSLFPRETGRDDPAHRLGLQCGTTLAIGAAGPHLADASTSFLAERCLAGEPRPRRPTLPRHSISAGVARREDGRWTGPIRLRRSCDFT